MIPAGRSWAAVKDEERQAQQAYLANARHDSAQLRSLIHDGLTGHNDLWLKTQLLAALDAVDANLERAAQ